MAKVPIENSIARDVDRCLPLCLVVIFMTFISFKVLFFSSYELKVRKDESIFVNQSNCWAISAKFLIAFDLRTWKSVKRGLRCGMWPNGSQLGISHVQLLTNNSQPCAACQLFLDPYSFLIKLVTPEINTIL